MQYLDFDFIGFTYNGKHSIKDLGIYRTSNGDRYEDNWLPTLQEKTASVEGMDGLYYFGTKVQQKQFNIPFAFQGLTEGQLRELKQTFNGDGIHDLIFDEYPFKVYSAKVTGSATMKYICFEDKQGRIYNGDGTLQFTCYYPYAHTPNSMPEHGMQHSVIIAEYVSDGQTPPTYKLVTEKQKTYNCGIFAGAFDFIMVPYSTNLIESATLSYKIGDKIYTDTPENINQLLRENEQPIYILSLNYNIKDKYTKEGAILGSPEIVINSNPYCYSEENNCFEARLPPVEVLSGKVLNHYSEKHFPTKKDWGLASGLPLHSIEHNNIGDVPAQFILTASGIIPKGSVFNVGNLKIVVGLECTNLAWNGKTGLVTGTVSSSTGPIPFTGNSCGTIPVGEIVYGGEKPDGSGIDVTLDYDYWYY